MRLDSIKKLGDASVVFGKKKTTLSLKTTEASPSFFSIIIPTYNESGNISEMLDSLSKNFPLAEIIVVDDNSPDKTWELVQDRAIEDSHIKLIRRFGKRSLVCALKEGIRIASGNVVVWLDCDFSMPPLAISKLVEKVGNSCDIAIGSRYIEGGIDARGSKFRVMASKAINIMAKRLLRLSVFDLTSGFVASKKNVFDKLSLNGYYGDYFIDFIFQAERAEFKVKEVPYTCTPRLKGNTKTAENPVTFMVNGAGYFIKILILIIRKLNDGC